MIVSVKKFGESLSHFLEGSQRESVSLGDILNIVTLFGNNKQPTMKSNFIGFSIAKGVIWICNLKQLNEF